MDVWIYVGIYAAFVLAVAVGGPLSYHLGWLSGMKEQSGEPEVGNDGKRQEVYEPAR